MDLVLRNAMLVDGTGAPATPADVGVVRGRIAATGEVPLRGEVEIDLAGLVLAPGFIDVHTHYDAQVFWDPSLSPSSWHGVTTVVTGNCGFGIAPLTLLRSCGSRFRPRDSRSDRVTDLPGCLSRYFSANGLNLCNDA